MDVDNRLVATEEEGGGEGEGRWGKGGSNIW